MRENRTYRTCVFPAQFGKCRGNNCGGGLCTLPLPPPHLPALPFSRAQKFARMGAKCLISEWNLLGPRSHITPARRVVRTEDQKQWVTFLPRLMTFCRPTHPRYFLTKFSLVCTCSTRLSVIRSADSCCDVENNFVFHGNFSWKSHSCSLDVLARPSERQTFICSLQKEHLRRRLG